MPPPDNPTRDALQRAPDFQLTLTRALLETLELRRILYVILSGITAGDGLGFNRAFLLLTDEGDRALRGQLAIGPESVAEASRIWEAMEAERFDLARVMQRYEEFRADPQASRLARQVERVSLPLPLEPGDDPLWTLLDRVLASRESILVNDRQVAFTGADLTLECFALTPLLLAERVVGVILVDNRYNGRNIAPEELDDLQTLANLAAVAVERARLHERIRRMAERDGLTGLLNRRRFDELLPDLFADCQTHREPLSALLLDVDEFKAVNDRHGHLAGDDLLRGLARLIQERVRAGDLPVRFGGDELAVVLPRAAGDEALAVAEELVAGVRATDFGSGGQSLRATVSIGVATLHAQCVTHTQLLTEADQALYAAKAAGRDRAVLFDPKR
ncbi:MAG: sensor domain-containing diguanylate cyclase [bacterium]